MLGSPFYLKYGVSFLMCLNNRQLNAVRLRNRGLLNLTAELLYGLSLRDSAVNSEPTSPPPVVKPPANLRLPTAHNKLTTKPPRELKICIDAWWLSLYTSSPPPVYL